MRPSWPVLGTIPAGLGVLGVGVWKAFDASLTTFALFVAAAILTELFEHSDRERSREPIENEPFRLASVVHVAAILVLGPWVGAVIAVAGVVAGALFRAGSLRTVLFRAAAFACGTAAA